MEFPVPPTNLPPLAPSSLGIAAAAAAVGKWALPAVRPASRVASRPIRQRKRQKRQPDASQQQQDVQPAGSEPDSVPLASQATAG